MICAYLVRIAASKVRDDALAKLREREASLANDPARLSKIQRVTHDILHDPEIRVGAYAPWIKDDAVIAVLIPSGGAGILTLLQYLFSMK